jgi:cytochrome P450
MPTPVHELDLPDLDPFSLERRAAATAFEAVRATSWLARMPFGHVVVNYEDVVSLLRDRRWHSAIAVMPQLRAMPETPMNRGDRQSILAMEGPEHHRLRRLAAPAFTPKAADRLRPFMREVINGLLNPHTPTGRIELVADLCDPYPIPIICELLGAPKSDWKLFSQWATDIFRIFNNDLENDAPLIEAAFAELEEYVRALIAERRGSPADDLLSDMIAAEEAGDRMSTDELVMMTEAVLMAGTDTTRNQLACAVALFTEHPDQWRLLAERPELASNAVEESMRYLGTVRGTARVASEDIVFRDVLFPKGSLVATSLAAANFDPSAWPEAQRFDITREPTGQPQLTFGSGIHFCLGANLARAELQEALPILAGRLPDLGTYAPIEFKPASNGIWGPATLPLSFTPAT